MIKLVIVDDSPTARQALRNAIAPEKRIVLIGEATNGEEALRMTKRYKPDLVIMDVHLRRENGIDITKAIMSTKAVPILVMTAIDPHDPQLVFDALNAGALEIRPKLPFLDAPNYEAERTRLVSLIKTLSQVPVVTRRRKNKTLGKTAIKLTHREMKPAVPHDKRYSHVLIGASTGGPEVVQGILGHLKVPFPLPIVIVQHISAGFVEGLANWLAESTRHRVSVCQATEKPDKGRVYLAPDGHHLCFDSSRCLRIVKGPPRGYQRPSIDELFSSAAPRIGSDTIAVLLSGMGHDGVDGLCELHRKGALTIVQELSTCVVPSMPRCAIEADVADLELTPVEIAKTLNRLARCS